MWRGRARRRIYCAVIVSSVGLSFDQPAETLESVTLGALNLLEAVRFLEKPIRIYHASSSECFGDVGTIAATEDMPFRPRSPYGVAKASAHWLIANYREAYGLFACNGILFKHESPLRPPRFVTRKIISAACRIAKGATEKLELDYIIATGEANSLEDSVRFTFERLGLNWHDHVCPIARYSARPICSGAKGVPIKPKKPWVGGQH